MRITDYFWTTTDIGNEWKNMGGEKAQEDDKDEKVWKKEVRRNFKNILEKMKPEQDEDEDNVIAYYKTSDKGDFIFQDNETPRRMQEILELSGKIDLMPYNEKENLKENLKRLLPMCRTMDEIKKFIKKKNGRMEVIEEYRLRCEKIEKMVDSYYIKTRSNFLYKKKFFVEVEKGQYANNKQRVDMYKAQYRHLRAWQIDWDTFMKKVVSIRKVEKYPIVREGRGSIRIEDLYEDKVEKCRINENYNEDELNEKISIKNDWRKECEDLVDKITNHALRNENKKDFDFLVIKAFEELEDIMDEVRKEYMERRIPQFRSREDSRNEQIDKWDKDICNSLNGSCKAISKEDLGHYYDALENDCRNGRMGKINIMEIIKNLTDDDRVLMSKKIKLEIFNEDTEFKPLKKQREN